MVKNLFVKKDSDRTITEWVLMHFVCACKSLNIISCTCPCCEWITFTLKAMSSVSDTPDLSRDLCLYVFEISWKRLALFHWSVLTQHARNFISRLRINLNYDSRYAALMGLFLEKHSLAFLFLLKKWLRYARPRR